MSIRASAVILALGLTACAAASESEPSINEAAFATCSTASITVDSRSRYQASIAGFLERARTSGCAYGGIQIAAAPQESGGKAEDYAGALAVARDFIDAFEAPWRLQPQADDPGLSINSLRVTLLVPSEADRDIASAQAAANGS